MKENPGEGEKRAAATAFDDFENAGAGKRDVHLGKWRGVLRVMSGSAFCLAIASAFLVLALDGFHFFAPGFSFRLKSAFPLIFIGISYGCLQFTLPRSAKEFALSMAVSIAFILWGAEQFVPNAAVASLIDDLVMFLFVLDLGAVIRGNLKQQGG